MTSKIKQERIERKKKDKEWSIKVKKIFRNKCAFCKTDRLIQAHHIIPREIKEFRYNHTNGIALCPLHHKWGLELSPHRNPLVFFMKLEEKYPIKLNLLKLDYKKFKENEKTDKL